MPNRDFTQEEIENYRMEMEDEMRIQGAEEEDIATLEEDDVIAAMSVDASPFDAAWAFLNDIEP